MIPITVMECGATHTIKQLTGKDNIRNQLANMGCVPGVQVTLLSNVGDCIMLGVNDSRIAIDRKLATRIIV